MGDINNLRRRKIKHSVGRPRRRNVKNGEMLGRMQEKADFCFNTNFRELPMNFHADEFLMIAGVSLAALGAPTDSTDLHRFSRIYF